MSTFYFYDLETSGFSARKARIMQFAGQRTDMNLKPVGKPDNMLVKIPADSLPEPDAALVHGITPQQTIAEGISEAELVKYLTSQVFTTDTIAVGYNNIRFDDEFIRFTFWRNFNDAYEWSWKDGRSRWDMLDVVRMTRALRPDGIQWPFASDGKPSNRLADVSAINKLEHANVHDALSDVQAVIEVARLIRNKQTKLFDYLLNIRDKKKVAALVSSGRPFVYTSGRYPSEYEKTTLAVAIAPHPERDAALVYDLRIDPKDFINLELAELSKLWSDRRKEAPYFPVKELKYNRCPAIAPRSVIDDKTATRLKLDNSVIDSNLARLKASQDFGDKLVAALEIMRPTAQTQILADPQKVDEQLYDGFVSDTDKTKMSVVRAATVDNIEELQLDFDDERLKLLLPLYKARNFSKSLTDNEKEQWEKFKFAKLQEQLPNFFKRLNELSENSKLSDRDRYILDELNLYAQSVTPEV